MSVTYVLPVPRLHMPRDRLAGSSRLGICQGKRIFLWAFHPPIKRAYLPVQRLSKEKRERITRAKFAVPPPIHKDPATNLQRS
jgi:hypothetical protein